MYDQIRGDIIFTLLYGGVTVMALIASFYLLFRRGNAFAPNITPPLRLRRWAAVLVAAFALNHVWYMPIFFLTSSEDIKMVDLVGGLLDSMTLFPLAIIVLLTMLQDRRQPLWSVAVMMAPVVIGGLFSVATRSYALLPMVYVYFLLMSIGFIIYMVRALGQYGRWLRDNYADLEHKEVWQSFVVLAAILLMFAFYAFTSGGAAYQYAMQAIIAMLICYLVWRVETLSDLTLSVNDLPSSVRNCSALVAVPAKNIGPLLKQYCEEPQLYLQHDISVMQLAKLIGTNRYYLSQYFSNQGITYNAYINGLRIQHFISLYHESATTLRPMITKQLAYQSGFRSYSTFSSAFKQMMGMTATEWMQSNAELKQD